MDNSILKMTGVTKKFPGVVALSNINFSLKKGEVHALVGANGAGKSTLIKVIAGAHQHDEGEIILNKEKVMFEHPLEAKSKGIGVIYQEFTLFPDLDIAQNIFFGTEPTYGKSSIINWKKVYKDAQRLLDKFGLNLNVTKKISSLSTASQQMVEIAKALSLNAKILVMDEPTATLTTPEVEKLFEIIDDLKNKGVSIIYISHRLEEVLNICDRLTVLRNGKLVGGMDVPNATKDDIIKMMIGRSVQEIVKASKTIETDFALEAKNISNHHVKNINLNVRKGEILGIAGLVGAGRTELIRAIFGADPITEGELIVNGNSVKILNPTHAVKQGIGLLPESRKSQGLFMNMNVRRNTTFASLKKFSLGPFLKQKKEKRIVDQYIQSLSIKTPSSEFMVKNLSGGNQQKVVLAKWLCTECNILILDEPTRGVDVGAKDEIFEQVHNLTKMGKSVIFISSELEEIMRVSDRVLTMYNGKITGEINSEDFSVSKFMRLITGG